MMSDLRFSRRAKQTKQITNCPLSLIDGSETHLYDIVRDKPLLLFTGSLSCPMTMSSLEDMQRISDKFRDKYTVSMLYVREAQPGENWPQPSQMNTKRQHALEFASISPGQLLVLVDGLEGDLHRQLDTKPNSLHIIDQQGQILFMSLWAGDNKAVITAIDQLEDGQNDSAVSVSECMVMPFLRGAAFMHDTLQQAGKRADRELMRGAPPIWLLSRAASVLKFVPHKQRGIVVMFVLLTLLIVLVAIFIFS
ncbi:MAG: hypothetical protein JJU48_09020 [Methylophaga sp.]|nr:hypothetical protein [Methylophaga sp.]